MLNFDKYKSSGYYPSKEIADVEMDENLPLPVIMKMGEFFEKQQVNYLQFCDDVEVFFNLQNYDRKIRNKIHQLAISDSGFEFDDYETLFCRYYKYVELIELIVESLRKGR